MRSKGTLTMDGWATGKLADQNSGSEDQQAMHLPVKDSHINIPGGDVFADAVFVREGYDLMVQAGNGQSIVVPDYFGTDTPPDLLFGGTALLKADVVEKLAGPMTPAQYAQIQTGPEVAQAAQAQTLGAAIGSVTELEGIGTATRVDGTQVTLGAGAPVYQGDVIETAFPAERNLDFRETPEFLEVAHRVRQGLRAGHSYDD